MPMVRYKKRPFTYTTYSRGRKRTRHVGLGPFFTSSSSSSADSRSATSSSTNNADISELPRTDSLELDPVMEADHNHANTTDNYYTEKSHTIKGSNNCNQYSLQKTKRLEDWKNIRSNVFSCFLDGEYLKSATCSECSTVVEENLLFRCVDCVQWDRLCIDCLKTRHQYPHLHLFEAWKNEAYIGYTTETPHWRISSHNNCETSYMKDMVIVDGKGRQHNRMVEFCSCECEAVRLVRYKLWPSTSKFPKLAFHFDLLDWLNGLLLESHVSVKAFCESLKARSSKHSRSCVNLKIQDIYKVLITETSEEYRHFIYKREHPFHDDGTECPCCFLSSRKVYSLDADFQLVRKATAGREWDHPKHQNHFFFDQNLVDNFMNDYQGDTTKPDVDCSEFQAGSMLRSKGRYKKLSETAVFGSTCRHEYPKYFFSLKHGERLGYSVFLIKKLLEEKEESEKLYILYDIACSLSNHLKKKSEESLLSETTFSIPIFHAYGHKVSCQVLYGPRRVNGLGLTDGESLERLWSYLGKFSNITKETTPENRIDILVDGLMYYGLKLREKLGTSLINKIKKAEELEKTSTETLAEILQPLSDASEETVLTWIQEEKQANTGNNENNQKVDLSLEEEYVQALDKLSRNEFVEGDNKYKCLKRTIRSLEKKLSLQKQWCLTDTPCLTYLLSVQEKQRQMLMNILQSLVSERAFLLDLIKKYARGQAISIRLSKQVKAVNEKLKQKIRDYNLIGGSKQHLPIHLTFDEVKDSNADMWITTEFDHRDDNIPISIKRQAINLKCLKDRAAEEQTLVKEEMLSVINYYRRQHTLLFQSFTLSLNGERAYAIKEGLFYETQISELLQKFTEYISNVNAPTTFKNLLGISSCSVECDTIDSDSSISDNSDYTDDSDDDTYDSDNNLM